MQTWRSVTFADFQAWLVLCYASLNLCYSLHYIVHFMYNILNTSSDVHLSLHKLNLVVQPKIATLNIVFCLLTGQSIDTF